MADGSRVTSQDIGVPALDLDTSHGAETTQDGGFDLRSAREAAERQVVTAALARTSGNMARTADLLGVSRPTLYDLMGRLGIRQHVEPRS